MLGFLPSPEGNNTNRLCKSQKLELNEKVGLLGTTRWCLLSALAGKNSDAHPGKQRAGKAREGGFAADGGADRLRARWGLRGRAVPTPAGGQGCPSEILDRKPLRAQQHQACKGKSVCLFSFVRRHKAMEALNSALYDTRTE